MSEATREAGSQPGRNAEAASSLRPFRHAAFRWLWIASVVANVGAWMYNAAAAWLMTSLDASPVMVSLVQVATTLPIFLFSLPAGALADIIDKRRFILFLEVLLTLFSGMFAALTSAELTTPVLLLVFMFLIGTVIALESPAWQSIVPQLVPREDLAAAIMANSVGMNISRAIGPALAGVIIAGFGIAAPFWLVAVSNLGVIGVLIWWRSAETRSSLPGERVIGAVRTGLRHARYNAHLRATLVRAIGFFLFASAYWTLLPLLARVQIGGGPEFYGLLLGAIGAGAVGGAFIMPALKARLGPNGLVVAGQSGTALSLAVFALSRDPALAIGAAIIAGMCWIAVLANLNVSAQLALPDWVRGRGLAVYVTVFFGTMTVGSLIWGALAERAGLPLTHLIAAAGILLAIPVTWRWRLQTGASLDLTPSMHWPEPVAAEGIAEEAGPVMVTVEYRVTPDKLEGFLTAVRALGEERKRDGAFAWVIFQDTADCERLVEAFFLESWLEHLRQHERVTHAARTLEEEVRRFASAPPRVTHFVAAQSRPEAG